VMAGFRGSGDSGAVHATTTGRADPTAERGDQQRQDDDQGHARCSTAALADDGTNHIYYPRYATGQQASIPS